MHDQFCFEVNERIKKIQSADEEKQERLISSTQGPEIIADGKPVLNFCANNYLGLSSHPEVIDASIKMILTHGYGLSSVRFICGTQDIHKKLEDKISNYIGMADTLLYSSAYSANAGVLDLFDENDVIFSDKDNHASIIDGIRVWKEHNKKNQSYFEGKVIGSKEPKREVYEHNDLDDLEQKLSKYDQARYRIIFTDGIFSMEGTIAQLDKIVELSKTYNAITIVDESHATGIVGAKGRGTHERMNVMNKIDIITSTLGKALGGACGGFVSGKKEIISFLRQKSRPYSFSNSIPPAIIGGALKAIEIISTDTELLQKLNNNTKYFRSKMFEAGFDIGKGDHAIVPVMIRDVKKTKAIALELFEKESIYVIPLYSGIVKEKEERIRVQISAAHTLEHLDKAIGAFIKVGKIHKIIN